MDRTPKKFKLFFVEVLTQFYERLEDTIVDSSDTASTRVAKISQTSSRYVFPHWQVANETSNDLLRLYLERRLGEELKEKESNLHVEPARKGEQ